MDKACRARLNEAIKQAKQAVKSKDPAAMDAAARQLEQVMTEVGCTAQTDDPGPGPQAHSGDDSVMDADFEPMDEN